MKLYDELTDKLMTFFSSSEFAEDASQARSDFHRSVGVFDEESEDLESKISLFIDWYLFVRHLPSLNVRPIDYIVDKMPLKEFTGEEASLASLKNSRYSLFEFIKSKGDDVYIKDLFSGYKLVLKDSHFVLGFKKDEFFSARLFPFEDSFVFAKAFCIHPSPATKFILSEIKKIKKVNAF